MEDQVVMRMRHLGLIFWMVIDGAIFFTSGSKPSGYFDRSLVFDIETTYIDCVQLNGVS